MMKKHFLEVIIVVCGLIAFAPVNAQDIPISISGQVGYASPQGAAFENEEGEKMAKFGLGVDFDALWHFEQLDYKLGVGLAFNSSFLLGADLGEGFGDIGMYGLSLYGVKGHWRFLDGKVSPYGALSFGLGQLSTPEITMTDFSGNETVITESKSSFNFGIRPEIGVELGNFLLSAGYLFPMKYKIDGESIGTAGNLQICIGYRYTLFDR